MASRSGRSNARSRWYETAHGLRHLSFRYFNACGATRAHGEDHRPETHIIPRLLATAQGRHDGFRLFGTDRATPDGTCVRDYVHVVDIAAAHVQGLGARSVPSGAFNLGLGRGYSNREVIAAVEKVTGRRVPVEPAPRRPGRSGHAGGRSDEEPASCSAGRRGFPTCESMVASAWAWRQAHPEGYAVVIITRTPLRVSFAGGGHGPARVLRARARRGR